MNKLNLSDKHIFLTVPDIVSEKLNQKVTSIKFVGGGSFGKVYKVVLGNGEIIAVKAYLLQENQHQEAEQLRVLGKHTSVKMPDVIFTYEDDKTALLAMTFVPGKNVLNPLFLLKSKSQKQKFADEVISGMLEWHSVTNEKFGELSNPIYDNWYDYYITEKQQPILDGLKKLKKEGKFPLKSFQLLLDATEAFNKLPAENTSPVLIHGDMNIMNIMADIHSFNLTAFIDPCDSMWADREYDLFQLRNMWGDLFNLYSTYKSKYQLSKYADFRVAYYGAMHESSMRLRVGHSGSVLELPCNKRLRKELKKLNSM